MEQQKKAHKKSDVIHLYDLLNKFKYRNKLFLLTFLSLFLTMFFIKSQKPELFRAKATVIATEGTDMQRAGSSNELPPNMRIFDETFFQTQFSIIKSTRVLDHATKDINKKITDYNRKKGSTRLQTFATPEIRSTLKLSRSRETLIISIMATHRNPAMAKLIANTVTKTFIKQNITWLTIRPDFRILDRATVPERPASVSPTLPLMFVLAFVVAILVVLIVEYFDVTIKDPQSISEIVDLPLLGVVPHLEKNLLMIETRRLKYQEKHSARSDEKRRQAA